LKLGSDLEFLDRPEWAAVRDAYGLRFGIARFGSLSTVSLSAAIRPSEEKAEITSARPLPSARYLAKDRAGDAKFVAALRPMLNRIPVEAMREANYRVAIRPSEEKAEITSARPLPSARYMKVGL
jgi:osmoprotectant transport system permease protein